MIRKTDKTSVYRLYKKLLKHQKADNRKDF